MTQKYTFTHSLSHTLALTRFCRETGAAADAAEALVQDKCSVESAFSRHLVDSRRLVSRSKQGKREGERERGRCTCTGVGARELLMLMLQDWRREFPLKNPEALALCSHTSHTNDDEDEEEEEAEE